MRLCFVIKLPEESRLGELERIHYSLAKNVQGETFVLSYNAKETRDLGKLWKGKYEKRERQILFPIKNLSIQAKRAKRYSRYMRALEGKEPFKGLFPMLGYFPPRMMREALKEISPDFLHVYAPHAFWLPYVACREANSLGVPYSVWTLYPFSKLEKEMLSEEEFLRPYLEASLLFFFTQYERDRFLEEYSIEVPSKVLPPPFDPAEVPPLDPDFLESCRRRLGRYDKMIFCHSDGRGAEFLLDSLRFLRAPERLLVVISGDLSEESLSRMMELRRELPWMIRPYFLGYSSKEMKYALLSLSDVFCCLAPGETCGLAYAEAWYFEKPVIGAKIPPIEEVFSAGKRGLLVKYGERRPLLEALISLLEDEGLRRDLGREGKKYVLEEMNAKKVSYEFLRAIERGSP